ncbi:hypothetical protein [Maridesulfovibrio zosterae]|uniref:hypothetical protein n=1 Tax=Maridesulfovibrio zosterae TaxID=82171 RepID=UPI00040B4A37|nr:hypothetical protein [Maridesulfovibrio zosterae]
MKNSIIAFLIVLILSVAGFAQASPYYLTLEGTVGSINDGGGLASAANIGVGANVKYVIQVDPDKHGVSGKGRDSIFGTLYAGVLSGHNTQGQNYINPYYEGFYAQTGNEKSITYIQNWGLDFADLAVGSTVKSLTEYSHSLTPGGWYGGETTLTLNNLKVTDISNVAPTPIPAAAVIMLGGLGLVGFIKRRFA